MRPNTTRSTVISSPMCMLLPPTYCAWATCRSWCTCIHGPAVGKFLYFWGELPIMPSAPLVPISCSFFTKAVSACRAVSLVSHMSFVT